MDVNVDISLLGVIGLIGLLVVLSFFLIEVGQDGWAAIFLFFAFVVIILYFFVGSRNGRR